MYLQTLQTDSPSAHIRCPFSVFHVSTEILHHFLTFQDEKNGNLFLSESPIMLFRSSTQVQSCNGNEGHSWTFHCRGCMRAINGSNLIQDRPLLLLMLWGCSFLRWKQFFPPKKYTTFLTLSCHLQTTLSRVHRSYPEYVKSFHPVIKSVHGPWPFLTIQYFTTFTWSTPPCQHVGYNEERGFGIQ